MSAFHLGTLSRLVTSKPCALYTAPTEPVPQNKSRSLLGAFLSHTPGGRTFGNSFEDFEAGKLSNPPEFVLSELAELPRVPTDRLVLAFRRGLRGTRGELE